jgi:hypothetical protein
MINNLYYRFYLAGKIVGDQSIPKNKAVSLFMVFQMVNVLSLFLLLGKYGIKLGELRPLHGIIFFCTMAGIIFWYFFKKHDEIEAKYNFESSYERKKGFFYLAAYIGFTIALFVFSLPEKHG